MEFLYRVSSQMMSVCRNLSSRDDMEANEAASKCHADCLLVWSKASRRSAGSPNVRKLSGPNVGTYYESLSRDYLIISPWLPATLIAVSLQSYNISHQVPSHVTDQFNNMHPNEYARRC